MIIRNFYDDRISQASYLVGCAATGEAIVIDPTRDSDMYVTMATSLGLSIKFVTETHIHADYLSGSRQLASKTGAQIFLSDEGGPDWTYGFGSDQNVTLLKDQDVIRVGNLTLRTLHTPGHTPEHLSFVLTDHPMSEEPHSIFTGDFIFVGDVGRPDLLERAANISGTMEIGARTLFSSIQKLRSFADSVLLWPGHGAGSACGKSLGGSPVTSLGYERKSNWALKVTQESKFVDEILSGQPEPPSYFKMMKHMNKVGPTLLDDSAFLPLSETVSGRLVDLRSATEVRNQCFLDALAIPLTKNFTNWAGWLLPYDEPIQLIANSHEQADAAVRALQLIGIDSATSWIHPDSLSKLATVQIEQTRCSQIKPDDFVLDIRGANEWNVEHVKGANHIPLGYLKDHLQEVPKDQRVVVYCAAGSRSLIGASLLHGEGFSNLVEVTGGISSILSNCSGLVQVACPV